MVTAKKKKRYPGCLAHAVIGMFTAPLPTNANPNIHTMFYSVGANRGQLLNMYILGGVGGGGRNATNRFRYSSNRHFSAWLLSPLPSSISLRSGSTQQSPRAKKKTQTQKKNPTAHLHIHLHPRPTARGTVLSHHGTTCTAYENSVQTTRQ